MGAPADKGYLYRAIGEMAFDSLTASMAIEDKNKFKAWLTKALDSLPDTWSLLNALEFYQREFLNKEQK
jgi:hypothetical protein